MFDAIIFNQHLNYLDGAHSFKKAFEKAGAFWEWLDTHDLPLTTSKVTIGTGACRAVIFRDDWDYAIKFCLDGNDLDYCANEEFIYGKATEIGLQKYFVECRYVCDYCGRKMYAVPVCEIRTGFLEDEVWKHCYEGWCDNTGNKYDPSGEIPEDFYCEYEPEDVFSYARTVWDDETVDMLLAFCEEYGVNDCHIGNWGYLNDQLVIIDYAGYGEGASRISRARLGTELTDEMIPF